MVLHRKEVDAESEKLRSRGTVLRAALRVSEKETRLEELQTLLSSPDVWSDNEKMAQLNKEKRILDDVVNIFNELQLFQDDLTLLFEFADEGEVDEEGIHHLITSMRTTIEKLEFKKMLGGRTDPNNAFININAGAGGRESQDWAVMLTRMYLRWAERRGFTLSEIDRVTGDDAAGIKSVTYLIEGDFVYGYLKAEIGVHRLVRISPFDSNKRRHTSFASLFVTPEIDDSIDIDIAESDIRIDTYRASGAGGQHINTTDSAVRITHLETNLVVQCQNERSQHKNKSTAMKMMRSKLYEYELQKKMEDSQAQEKQKMAVDFGSQIRSYVLHPYKMVKDHRTNFETGNADAVLGGEEILDGFMERYLLTVGGDGDA
ncbi:peptide chain release factor 2 [bacterium]|nr:peptide chain release factor 2 [bacterium]